MCTLEMAVMIVKPPHPNVKLAFGVSSLRHGRCQLMIWLGLLCLLAGAVLGVLFTPYVLIPATVLSLTAVVGLGFVNGVGPWQIVLYAVVIWIALQIGYVVGRAIALAFDRPHAEIWRPRTQWWPWVRFSWPAGG
jgi:hypothetical protein